LAADGGLYPSTACAFAAPAAMKMAQTNIPQRANVETISLPHTNAPLMILHGAIRFTSDMRGECSVSAFRIRAASGAKQVFRWQTNKWSA
jgi:hypothetical protein